MSNAEHAKKAAQALAHMYVWDSIRMILEGSSAPDRQDDIARRKVARVIDTVRKECERLLGIYDKHIAATHPERK